LYLLPLSLSLAKARLDANDRSAEEALQESCPELKLEWELALVERPPTSWNPFSV
jgi:hypothetical protein